MAAPKYAKDDIVYLTASADKGSLESFKVMALCQRPNGLWYYKFSILQRPPTAIGTIGDRITKKRSYDIEVLESDVTTLADALNRAETYLNSQLTKIAAIRQQYLGTS